jgi:predicted GTPase
VILIGAGGRNFDVVYRDHPDAEVVAFTAAQIPGGPPLAAIVSRALGVGWPRT